MTKKVPRVAAIHDMSGFGKCSLTVALPVISACGAEVCPLPTAILSNSTHLPSFTFFDCTEQLKEDIDQWQNLHVPVDAVYSGFLGSAEQIGLVVDAVRRFTPSLVVIDPVMGDNGVIYKTYTPEMCARMRDLAAVADVLTPNLTEACVLADVEYHPEAVSAEDIRRIMERIAALGARSILITGIERGDILVNCAWDAMNGYRELETTLLPYRFHGTGDVFTSALTGALIRGHSLDKAMASATEFVSYTMLQSSDVEDVVRRGVCFEPYLGCFRDGLFVKPKW